jgi:uncharacterized protein YkwD
MKAALFFVIALLPWLAAAETAPAFPLHPLSAQAWSSAENRERLLALINAERASHGLQTLREQTQLRAAAQAHADYLAAHGQASHEQRPGQAGFSGRRPYERAVAAGFPLQRREQISELFVVGLHGAEAALAQLLSGPYHRHALLAPRAAEIGIGLSAQPGLVISLASSDKAVASPSWLLWPRPGQQQVATAACCERPRPAGLEEFGTPVSVQALSGERLHIEGFELLAADGSTVATELLQAATDPHLRSAPQVAYLLPRQALQSGQRYRVRLQAQAGGERIERDWFFDTAP